MDLILGTDPIASWWLAVAVVAVVTLVVAILLALVIRTASAINDEVATVWANGQRVANNTIHIAALYQTRDYVKGILGHAGHILKHSQAIRDHATDSSSHSQSILQKVN
ncbi:MAG: hypothetical protein VW313_08995 [Gammaproteobacteria bacterium]|jgi:hypothetical protein